MCYDHDTNLTESERVYHLSWAVKLLLEKGAELESKDKIDWTPLWWAAANGHEMVVRLLLEKGAKLEYKDKCSNQTLLS
jgi:ankyrin repeat protein